MLSKVGRSFFLSNTHTGFWRSEAGHVLGCEYVQILEAEAGMVRSETLVLTPLPCSLGITFWPHLA